MAWRREIVRALNTACTAVDAVAYRPAIVRLTMQLPRWWRCQFAHLSMRLDDHWETGYWSSDSAPAAPEGLCDACGRRAAWLIVGGRWDEDDPEGVYDGTSFRTENPAHLCGWCRFDSDDTPIETNEDLDHALNNARRRSIAWAWR
jgi:hypothetical protein